jgi:dolichol-phosphate mannosyltransferase
MEHSFDLTIIIPLFNEAENLNPLSERLSDYLENSNWNSCVLFVDDGSTDQGRIILRQLCSQNERFQFIRLSTNAGLSAALKAGIDQAKTPLIGYMDADLQTAPEDFELLLSEIGGFDLVTGIRMSRQDHPIKKISSLIANAVRNAVTGDGISDTGCPLKVFRREMAQKIHFFKGMHRFLPALVLLENGKVKTVPVRHFPRAAGKSKYHLWNRLLGPTIDLMVFWWMKSRHINYHIEERG